MPGSTRGSSMIELVRRLLRTPQGALGLSIVVLVLVLILVGPLAAPHDPDAMARITRYKGPGPAYWLGTDQYGRDILSRLLYGARATVVMAFLATALGSIAG